MRWIWIWIAPLFLLTGCGDALAERAAFGDSVTFGYGGERGGWVSILAQDAGSPIANYGVPTERVVDGKARFIGPLGPLALEPWLSDLLLLEGGNDLAGIFLDAPCLRRCTPADAGNRIDAIVSDLAFMVDQAREHGKNVTVGTYWRVNAEACSSGPTVLHGQAEVDGANAFIDAFDTKIVAMAYDRRVPVVRLDHLDLERDASNFYDCIHPNDQGYHLVAGAWRAALE